MGRDAWRRVRRWGRVAAASALVAALALVGSGISPRTPVGFVARSAYWQARLLAGRVPLDEAPPEADPGRAANLARVPRIKEFAERRLGLVAGRTYATITPGWDRVVWNVSGCRPLAFEPKRYWFPFVGSVPYIGYFDERAARDQARRLEADGYETYVRTAGTYSTLGWFADPVLPSMLDWTELRLADTLVHELVHANVWVRGSATFNESLANFVGEQGGELWIAETYGEGSPELATAIAERDDTERWRALLAGVVEDLTDAYTRPAPDGGPRPPDEIARDKAAILGSMTARADAAGFHDLARYRRSLEPAGWNNARLLQYKTYNRGYAAFEALWQREHRDPRAFLDAIRALSTRGGDPWQALTAETGVPTEPE